MKVGLALGGGALRGAAHVGVLEVLEEAGIEPCCIAGTSVGSIVGAAYAAGMPAVQLATIFRTLKWQKLARPAVRKHFMGLIETSRIERLFEELVGVSRVEDLAVPFAAVSCDLLTGERVVMRSGPLGKVLMASSAIPGIFPPVELDGKLLADGCLVENLPISVARSMGAEYVIAVDLVPPPNGKVRPRNVLEVVMVAGYLWSRASQLAEEPADCVITPDVAEFLGWDFDEVPELEKRGREAARRCLNHILSNQVRQFEGVNR